MRIVDIGLARDTVRHHRSTTSSWWRLVAKAAAQTPVSIRLTIAKLGKEWDTAPRRRSTTNSCKTIVAQPAVAVRVGPRHLLLRRDLAMRHGAMRLAIRITIATLVALALNTL